MATNLVPGPEFLVLGPEPPHSTGSPFSRTLQREPPRTLQHESPAVTLSPPAPYTVSLSALPCNVLTLHQFCECRLGGAKKPSVEQETPHEPRYLEQERQQPRCSPGKKGGDDPRMGGAPKSTVQALIVGFEPFPRVASIRLYDGGRGEESRFDRRPDPFTALGIGEARCVAGQQHTRVTDPSTANRTHQIRVTLPAP